MPTESRIAKLALEDGTVFTGAAFGAIATRVGEVAFNTAMTGYQEIITDPSYRGQIVCMTCPQIGNYGVNPADIESRGPQVEGFVIRELSRRVSNFRATQTLEDWLAAAGVPGIADVDTRAITRKLRTQGALKGAISSQITDDEELVGMARAWNGLVGVDLVQAVMPSDSYDWSDRLFQLRPRADESVVQAAEGQKPGSQGKRQKRVVAIDCGCKQNILRYLVDSGCHVTVVPARTSAADILDRRPQGVLVSNGPGDPEPLHYVIDTLRNLVGRVPLFGICLGHQLLALAQGGQTYKLKFGHRGANQPVRNMATGRVEITSQNHGFAVDVDSIKNGGLAPTHVNLNDGTLEGFRHVSEPVFAVQYHPEASPGPHDATYLFDLFAEMIDSGKSPTAEQMADAQARLARGE